MVNLLHHVFSRLDRLELYRPQTTAVDLEAANTNKRTAAVFLLQKHFSLNEIKSLCFVLNIRYSDIPGETFKRKTEELVDYCERHGRFGELLSACREQEPNAPWAAVLGLDTGPLPNDKQIELDVDGSLPKPEREQGEI